MDISRPFHWLKFHNPPHLPPIRNNHSAYTPTPTIYITPTPPTYINHYHLPISSLFHQPISTVSLAYIDPYHESISPMYIVYIYPYDQPISSRRHTRKSEIHQNFSSHSSNIWILFAIFAQ